MSARPAHGTPEHRRWVVECIVEAAARLGKRIDEVSRDQAIGARVETDEHWPCTRDLATLGGWAAVRALAAADEEPPSVAELGQRREVQRENLYRRRLEREVGDTERAARLMREALADALQLVPPVLSDLEKPPARSAPPAEVETVALLSDWHFGSIIDSAEVPGGGYDWTIAARRLGLMCEQIATFKPHHRDRATLRLLLGGDMIEGELHGRSPQIDHLAQQVDGARQLLTDAIDYLRHHYARIDVVCTPGNHGRWNTTHRPHGRASEQKWDSLATTLYRGLAAIFRHCDDVTWTIPRAPFSEWRAPGNVACALTHGDTVVDIGSVGSKVDVGRFAQIVRGWNATRERDDRLRLVAIGHYHVPLATYADDGVALVVNGGAPGNAPYSLSAGRFGSYPAQCIWESVPGYPVGDWRAIGLTAADKRPELERICATPQRIGDAA